MSKEIPLQNGMFAIVDDKDYEKVNKFNWTVRANGTTIQVCRRNNDTNITLGRFILRLTKDDNKYVIHKDGNRLNFERKNLVVSEMNEVRHSSKGINGTSRYKGVSWHKAGNKWMAQISFKGKRKYLGSYVNEDDAASAYNEAAIEWFGEHAYLNEIGEENSASEQVLDKSNQWRKKYDSESNYQGITYINKKNKWRSQISFKGRKLHIGVYDSAIISAKAYDEKAYELYGEKAILNFPELVEEYKKITPTK